MFTHSVEDCYLISWNDYMYYHICMIQMNFSGNDKFNGKKSEYQGIIIIFLDLIHNYFENYKNSNMIITPPPPTKREEF